MYIYGVAIQYFSIALGGRNGLETFLGKSIHLSFIFLGSVQMTKEHNEQRLQGRTADWHQPLRWQKACCGLDELQETEGGEDS